MSRLLFIAALCGILCACNSSPRKQYFLLNVPDIAQSTTRSQAADNINTVIGIGPIEVADYLDRLPMVYTQTTNNLQVADNSYWAEPLDKGIARVLTLNLTQRDNNRSFTQFPWRSDSKPQYSLRLQIYALSFNNSQASINATWELFDNNKRINLNRQHFNRTVAAQPGAKAMAESYSQLLAALAEEMDRALQQAR